MKPIDFHPLAEKEVEEAAAYYENQREGLGREFRLEFEAAMERLSLDPLHFPQEIRHFRACTLKRFPYTIFFFYSDTIMWIAAVAHQSRRPGYWSSRRRDPS